MSSSPSMTDLYAAMVNKIVPVIKHQGDQTRADLKVILVGKSNVGKTTTARVILQLADELSYSQIVVVSQTAQVQNSFTDLTTNPVNILSELPTLRNFIDWTNQCGKDTREYPTLIICDDVKENTYKSSTFRELTKEGRHYGIDLLVIVHDILDITPADTRASFDVFWIVNGPPGEAVLPNMLSFVPDGYKQQLKRLVNSPFQKNQRELICIPRSMRFMEPFRCPIPSLMHVQTRLQRYRPDALFYHAAFQEYQHKCPTNKTPAVAVAERDGSFVNSNKGVARSGVKKRKATKAARKKPSS